MNMRISPPVQRLAALAILVGVTGAAVGGLVEPIASAYLGAEQSVEQQRAAIAHASAAGADPEALKAELAGLRARQGTVPGALKSANDSLAAADLQNRLKSAIEAAHGELRSVQTLPSRVEGGFRRVTIRGHASMKIAALRHALYDLESSSPLLFLDNVEIDARPDKSGRHGAAEDPNLDIRFDLYGYMKAAP